MESPTLRVSDLAALAELDRTTLARHGRLPPESAVTHPVRGGHPSREWVLEDLVQWAESVTRHMSDDRVRLALALRLA